jgi:hypothetical protein
MKVPSMSKLASAACAALLASTPALSAQRRPLSSSPSPLVVGAVSHLLLPTAASGPGRFGSFYRTKISIFNASTFDYMIRAGLSQGSGEVASSTISIRSGETLTYDDFVFDVFAASGGGAIDLDSGDARFLFIVNAQVYTDSASGRYTTPVQFGDEASNIIPSRPGYVVGVSVDATSRTNIGCASNSSFAQTITFQAFDSANFAVGSPFSFALAGFGWAQYAMNVPLTDGGVRIDATDKAVCFGVEVNNASNDGTYQLAVPF